MDDDELLRVADFLQHSVQHEAQSRIEQGVPWGQLTLTLNRAGCLALAANLLRLAPKPIPPDQLDVTQELDRLNQINETENDMETFQLRRVESIEVEPAEQSVDSTWGERLTLIGCICVAMLLSFLLLSGVWFWARLVFTSW